MKNRSSGKNIKKSRKEIALENLKKIKQKKRQVDWIKLEKYKANRLSGLNRHQAAVAAGWSESTARRNSYKYDRLAKIGIIEALEKAGATNNRMAHELVRLATSAMKRSKCTVEVRTDEDGEVVIDDKAAELVPDEHLRAHTWELIGKFKKQLGSHTIPAITDFDRLVIVVERNSQETPNAREGNPVNQEAVTRVRLTDQPI